VEPLGRVVQGLGNNGEDGTEGHFIGMRSLHGPILPKILFRRLADSDSTDPKVSKADITSTLDDTLANLARVAMFKRLRVSTS